MRKLILLILVSILLCSVAQAETLVVWFSCTSNTEALAHTAAEALNADFWQIIPEKPYSDEDLNYHDSSCRANREQADPACRPALLGTEDVTLYDSIVLAYPIWWGEEPRIVVTWIESVDLAGKQMAAICTSGGSGIQTSYAHLQEKAPDALWLGAERFSANTTPAELSEWCASIGLEKENEVNMRIAIGDHILTVRLADNESTAALKALLANGPVTIPASHYGGFEKVCPIGTRLPSHDEYTVTKPGDVMLYAGSSIVLFHGGNSWEYTRLGWIDEMTNLTGILSGNENEITLSLE